MYDHHLQSKWSQQLFRVKVINKESLYIEGSRRVDGRPPDVIHLQARASSHQKKNLCYPGFPGTTCCHHLVCKDRGVIYSSKNNEALLPSNTVWECKLQEAGASTGQAVSLSFTCSVLQLFLQQNSNIILLFLINSSSLCLLILSVQFETWELFCCKGGDSEIPIFLLNKNVLFSIKS